MVNARQKSSLQIARELAADAVALSKEHAGRADAAEGRWQALREWLETREAGLLAAAAWETEAMRRLLNRDVLEVRAVLAKMTELEARRG